ncbi:ligase-associated DNA damage response DEXH box helicase [Aliiroseovarius lamellibrachiae]|uniref:ligase-associated DNA damage response DEXH box helicase n=1 Tax=Aliiroseovarius lamellibrachiae TaxID=1924933 RepID=UPI001BE0A067|nr:ligase-associated DNA damage response DEXH box helicase [Aliiroseovarius lamellibrachiae]MBT2130843.1 ligase-associated DNA damage response DEXH box helicase [Aliiroseovarius lamellibrachiae]
MTPLPPAFITWFASRGWAPHPHQIAMLDRSNEAATLLIAPTGGGKTLAGFLPSMVDLAQNPHKGLHTLYISPLKALAADMRRNLQRPVEDMGLNIRIEDRSGDTTQTRKKAQRADPPHILLTTPESLALLLSYPDAPHIFAGLKRVVVDELHALAESKRGDQLMLCLTRLQAMRPNLTRVGLSATVDDPDALARYLAPHPAICDVLTADPGPTPDIQMLPTNTAPPWSGGGARYAIPEVLEAVKAHKTTLIFHNTRAQAEIFFHDLWLANTDNLPIAIHHGSLDRNQRSKVEAAMVAGHLRAVVCTGSLDLGLDWGDVDLVIQVGAPKNIKRLVQRIGRSGHHYNTPSKALILPANRWEILECQAAIEAVVADDLDGDPRGPGPRDVLCQHLLITACAAPFDADTVFAEVTQAGSYAALTRADFDACLDFVATGGYALRAYDRWQRLRQTAQGLWQLRDPRQAALIRMNIGTIIDTDTLKVRMRGRGGKALGEVEESFAASLTPGDTFLIGGKIVRFESLREMVVQVSNDRGRRPRLAVFSGTKFSTSLLLSDRILHLLQSGRWDTLPAHTQDWVLQQKTVSQLPEPGRILVESFLRDDRAHTCLYGFAGKNAQQTLGLLATRQMEQLGLGPLGFVATDYATLIWSIHPVTDPAPLFDLTHLHAGLETWLGENALMKRSFKTAATIAGLITRNHPGQRTTGRQATFSTDILYDTLRKYDPDHLLLALTREEAMRGLIDFGRIKALLSRTQGKIDHVCAPHVTPFSAPLFLEIGRVPVEGTGQDMLLATEAQRLMAEAGLAQNE